MKLNYSLNTGFASGDGATPTRDNVSSWICLLYTSDAADE